MLKIQSLVLWFFLASEASVIRLSFQILMRSVPLIFSFVKRSPDSFFSKYTLNQRVKIKTNIRFVELNPRIVS